MNMDIESALTKGLLAGYAGGKVEAVNRGKFTGKASHVELAEGQIYHDEWFASHSGGGQELVQVGDSQFTRLYAGGPPDVQTLTSLGISANDVGAYLKKKITELGEKTRLMKDCEPEPENDWKYRYKVTGNYPETSVTTSLESIEYKGTVVHHHAFILSPIK